MLNYTLNEAPSKICYKKAPCKAKRFAGGRSFMRKLRYQARGFLIWAWAAAMRAMGTRKGLQET